MLRFEGKCTAIYEVFSLMLIKKICTGRLFAAPVFFSVLT